jgi:hypothetical protein
MKKESFKWLYYVINPKIYLSSPCFKLISSNFDSTCDNPWHLSIGIIKIRLFVSLIESFKALDINLCLSL